MAVNRLPGFAVVSAAVLLASQVPGGASRTAAAHVEQMPGQTEDARIASVGNGQFDDERPQASVVEQRRQGRLQTDGQALGRAQRHLLEAGPCKERLHLVERDAVPLREPPRYVVDEHAIVQHPLDEASLEQVSPLVRQGQRASQERERRHQRDEHDPVVHQHATHLGRRPRAVSGVGQVVEGAEADQRIEAAVGPGAQIARVGLSDRLDAIVEASRVDALPGERQQGWRQIGEGDAVAALGEPDRVAAGSTAEVEHACPRRQVLRQRRTGHGELDAPI